MYIVRDYRFDPEGLITRRMCPDTLSVGDREAHLIRVALPAGWQPASCMGELVRPDMMTVPLEGRILTEDGTTCACVLLNEGCYQMRGLAQLTVRVSIADAIITVLQMGLSFSGGATEKVYDPADVIPSVTELLAQVGDLGAATAEARQAAADAQTAIDKAATDAQAALAEAQMAALQAANGSAPPIVQGLNGTYIDAKDASPGRVFPRLRAFGRSPQNGTPSPEAPVKITGNGTSGKVTVRVYGKNLFPGGAPTNVTSTNSSGSQQTRWGYAISLPAGTYTLWAQRGENVTGVYYLYGVVNGADGTWKETATLVANATMHVRTIDIADGDTIYLYDGYGGTQADAETLFERFRVMIVMSEGDLATKGGSVDVSVEGALHSIPVTKDGSYTDADGQMWLADEIDLVRGVCIRRIGKVVLDGVTAGKMASSKSSNTQINTYNVPTDDWDRASGADVVLVLSHYPYKGTTSGSSGVTKDGVVMLCSVPGSMYVGHSSITTLADYNAWLAAQHAAGTPVTVLYPLAQPVETPLEDDALADAAKLRSLYPVTTITADGAWIDAQYVADTKIYIDNLFASLAAQLINA